ncbi:MAG: hypothetical protein AB1714_24500 [Acidobacteriota bacterium]
MDHSQIHQIVLQGMGEADLGMPGMNGWQVGKRVREICEQRGMPKSDAISEFGLGAQGRLRWFSGHQTSSMQPGECGWPALMSQSA